MSTNLKLDCSRIEELIGKVVDREALDWEVEAVRTHLPTCANCTELERGMRELGGVVRRDIATAVAAADFSGLMARIDAGIDRASANRDTERLKNLFFSWPAVTRWVATGAVAAAFAFAVLLPGSPLHDFEGADNRVEVSSIEGGTDNAVMVYESEDDNVTFIWVIEDEDAMNRVARIMVAVAFAASALMGTAAWADEPSAEIRVRVIQATNTGKKFDPDLEDLRKFLGQHKFSSFKQVIDERITVKEAETKGIGLLSGKNLNVTLKSLKKDKATIQLLLLGQAGQILDTTVAAGPHKLFFIAGPKYEEGVLFIAIEPHYDPETLGQVDVGANPKVAGDKKNH